MLRQLDIADERDFEVVAEHVREAIEVQLRYRKS